MTVYDVDDGGSSTAPYDTWAKAHTSLFGLTTALTTLAAGDIVYIGHDHVDAAAGGDQYPQGPGSGIPAMVISATQGSNPPTYAKSSTNQINGTASGSVFFLGAWAMYGVRIQAGWSVGFFPAADERIHCEDCTFAPAANKSVILGQDSSLVSEFINCTIDLTADGTTNRSVNVFAGAYGDIVIRNLTAVNPAYRTGTIFGGAGAERYTVSSCDLSGFTQASLFTAGANSRMLMSNCKTIASPTYETGGTFGVQCFAEFYNVASADDPSFVRRYDKYGSLISSTSIYRSTGALIEAEANTGWLITTTAACADQCRFNTPWLYGVVDSTGSKTFTLYITNDTADLTDAETWLELEYLATSNSALWTSVTDKRADITATAAAQTDDVTSTWNGTGPSFTYKQSLAVTATIGETGQYRARVAVAKASIASGSYFYVDPKVTVT